ncbi:MAG: class I SAM-dependent methyltransferase [Candidatus Peribacteraceae bacterium]|nr:class I SAM-dependent methyltransferase [Candidatus Peribacteraceae bacterium]
MHKTSTHHPLSANINVRMREAPVLRMLDLRRGEQCLDVGCGLGYMLEQLKDAGAELHGIDVSAESIDYVKERVTPHATVGSCLDIPYPNNMFNKVLFCEVIEHLEDDEKALQEIRRVLKPGGRLVVSTPALEGVFSTSPLKRLGHHHGGEHHARDGYYSKELQNLLQANGYRVVETRLCMFLFSELLMELTKIVFLLKQKTFSAQSDILKTEQSFSYRALRRAIALLLPLFSLEDRFWIPLTKKGHALIISAEKLP